MRRNIYTRKRILQRVTIPGVYYESTLGLISISGDGLNWITIQDKNLGATVVYNDGDTLSESNCGYYYQWGNNYGFAWTGTITTATAQIDTTGYGPGNYYSDSTFLLGHANWISPNNDDLWGGTTGTVSAMQGPCDNGYHIPTNTERQNIYNILIIGFGLPDDDNTMKTYLKLPLAGDRDRFYNGDPRDQGSMGLYCTTIQYNASQQHVLVFNNTGIRPNNYTDCANGISIRAFKNTPEIPDSTWIKIY